jgi:cell division protein FtsN
MSRNAGNRSAPPRKGGALFTGILIGMVIGAGMAAGLAWYIMQSPSPFVQKEPMIAKPPADIAQPAPDAQPAAAASGVADGKPRFEFYKVLTDKQDATVAAPPARPADKPQPAKPQPADSKPAAADEAYVLQAGSFSNADDAEKLKARLALLGIEASTQTATIPDKGVWHRVRLGPYKNAEEMNKARALLKQNGVDATPMRAQ